MFNRIKSLAVFCGASFGINPDYARAAKELAELLASANINLVYGGGKVGLMGVLADHMLHLGGKVYGVIPRSLTEKEVAHASLSELHIVNTMHERKHLMAQLADAFVILPGGIGSLDEFFEAYTWAKLGIHAKPIGILNTSNYYHPMIQFLDHAVQQGFLHHDHRDLITIDDHCDTLLGKLNAQIQ